MKKAILIIDDKLSLCKSLAQNFRELGYTAYYAANEAEAIDIFLTQPINVAILDIRLGEENGIDVLKHLFTLNAAVPVIMMTAYATIETAVESIKMGAFDFIQKPIAFGKLLKVVENALKLSDLEEENQQYKERLIRFTSDQMVTQDTATLGLCQKAIRLASTDLPILLQGESGTGKELMADYIHANSPRACYPMQKINCASFPESLLDNELFGHEKGAFTGADSRFAGVFEQAHKSSLFLDEIGDMPLTIQSKILRTIQNQEIRRLGGKETINVDVRFIAATNRDVSMLVAEKTFRNDLYYRLNAAILHLPPLSERKADIPLLVERFLQDFCHKNRGEHRKVVSPAVLEIFMTYGWPGNIRELYNTVNYAATVSLHEAITIDDLPPVFINRESGEHTGNIRERIEKALILRTLQETGYNKKKSAKMLDMGRRTLYYKMEKYGIALSQERQERSITGIAGD